MRTLTVFGERGEELGGDLDVGGIDLALHGLQVGRRLRNQIVRLVARLRLVPQVVLYFWWWKTRLN